METFDENGPFGSVNIPVDVQFASKLLSAIVNHNENDDDREHSFFALIPHEHLDSLSKICYDYTMSKKFSRIQYLRIRQKILDHWQSNDAISSLNLTSLDLDKIFSGLLTLSQCIRKYFRNNSQNNFVQLRQSMLKHFKMPEKIYDMIFQKFFFDFPDCARPNLVAFADWDWIATGNRLVSIRWQLHLAISDRFLSRIMEPFVRFEFVYGSCFHKQHRKIVFECQMKQFHQLRFTVAWLLKEMIKLESNKILSL